MKQYDAYIFDMDWTLLDTSTWILDSLYEAIIQCGINIDRKKISTSLIWYKIWEIIDILGLWKDDETKSKIIAKFREIYDANAHKNVVWYDFPLKYVKNLIWNKKDIFIATNKPSRATNLILEKLNIDFAKDVYYPDKYDGKTLDKSEMIADIIGKYGLKPSNVAYIWDTDVDYKAACENGCDFWFAKHGYSENAEYLSANADFIFWE